MTGLDDLEAFVRDRSPALLRYGYVLTGNRTTPPISRRRRWPASA
jgi:hypothetical protein